MNRMNPLSSQQTYLKKMLQKNLKNSQKNKTKKSQIQNIS